MQQVLLCCTILSALASQLFLFHSPSPFFLSRNIFGVSIQGNVKVNAIVLSTLRHESLPFYERIDKLVCLNFTPEYYFHFLPVSFSFPCSLLSFLHLFLLRWVLFPNPFLILSIHIHSCICHLFLSSFVLSLPRSVRMTMVWSLSESEHPSILILSNSVMIHSVTDQV